MTDPFHALSPGVQHGVVNDFQWPALRPIQAQAIGPVLAGENVLLRAPTAGGKTEAAFLPVLSRWETERWRGLSVLYLSPIRALVNNQAERLQRMFRWVGAEAGVWHGDTPASTRKRLRASPPEALLTTPESIEGMLCSQLFEPKRFFAHLQVVVIDEAHAFCAGDRGWHLRAVLERLSSLAGRDLQRVGLSATVGNLSEVLDFIAGRSQRVRRVVAAEGQGSSAEVRIDAVDGVEAAARLLSLLHRGEKRLVFTDSRVRCERLGEALRAANVRVHVTHSSLSSEERRRAERAFVEERDCVIVSTSALELGIDIGDLDRVIQVGGPSSVASFLQRMGRTGRRAGTRPNCLTIALDDASLLRAVGVVIAWRKGHVEDARCPPAPWHILVQQCLATLLQHGHRPHGTWRSFAGVVGELFGITSEETELICHHLIEADWVSLTDGLVHVGPMTELHLGRQHFIELLSVFSSPPSFTLRHGTQVIGEVHEQTFWGRVWQDGSVVLALGGRGWRVEYLDRHRRIAYVTPCGERGISRWVGSGPWLPFEIATEIRSLFSGFDHVVPDLTRRAQEALARLIDERAYLAGDDLVLEKAPDGTHRLWTFAGTGLNRALARRLRGCLNRPVAGEDLCLEVRFSPEDVASNALEDAVGLLRAGFEPPGEAADFADEVHEKFVVCLPLALRTEQSRRREVSPEALSSLLARPLRVVTVVD